LWKFFNEKVRCNKYFEKFADCVLAAKGFFRGRKKFKEEVRSRLSENFQLFGLFSMDYGRVLNTRNVKSLKRNTEPFREKVKG